MPMTKKAVKSRKFFLLVEPSINGSFLVSFWMKFLKNFEGFLGVLVRENEPSATVIDRRMAFHAKWRRRREWTSEMHKQYQGLSYNAFNLVEQHQILQQGVPACSVSHHQKTYYLGRNINREFTEELFAQLGLNDPPVVFSALALIIKPWLIKLCPSRLINLHTAVLPYARGVFAVENCAALKDIEQFRKMTGATIHFIDEKIDTGPVIRSERYEDPFRFSSIWELKAAVFNMGNELYVRQARDMVLNPTSFPAGIPADQSDSAIFYGKDFTTAKKQQAEEGYLWMKKQAGRES